MLSNLPPGITEGMLPGNRQYAPLVEEDFVEMDRSEWDHNVDAPNDWECDACKATVGFYEGRSENSEDAVHWAACWVTTDDTVVCDDCREGLLERAAEYEAAAVYCD